MTASTEHPRIQITLDSWVAEKIIEIEDTRKFGENKKEITNYILREWLREYEQNMKKTE